MKIKINQNLKLELEQLEELASAVQTPDMGWEVDSQLVEYQGDYGNYTFRVNLKKELITLLNVSK